MGRPLGIANIDGPAAFATSDYDYSPDELEFMRAMDRYIYTTHRPFPTWSEALKVAKSLGYRKCPTTCNLSAAPPS